MLTYWAGVLSSGLFVNTVIFMSTEFCFVVVVATLRSVMLNLHFKCKASESESSTFKAVREGQDSWTESTTLVSRFYKRLYFKTHFTWTTSISNVVTLNSVTNSPKHSPNQRPRWDCSVYLYLCDTASYPRSDTGQIKAFANFSPLLVNTDAIGIWFSCSLKCNGEIIKDC